MQLSISGIFNGNISYEVHSKLYNVFFHQGIFGNGFPRKNIKDRRDKVANNKKLYDVLEINQKAIQAEKRKSFRKLAFLHHPDKGGDSEKFKEINAAYEILSNEEKRQIYDKCGFEGLKSDGMGSGGFGGTFNILFGGRSQHRTRKRETPKLNRQSD